MEKYLSKLRACSLFNGISDGELLTMLTCLDAKVVSFDKKYTIFSEGNPSRYIGILLSGSAQITRVDYYGNRSIIAKINHSEVFAEAFACAEVKSIPVSVIAEEAVEVMLIDSAHILHTCKNNCRFHQQLIFNLMKDLAVKALMYHRKIEIISKRTTREKLMTYLMIEAKSKRSNRFEIPFDRQELADYLEVDRSGLSAEIGKLKKEGVIEVTKNRFELL